VEEGRYRQDASLVSKRSRAWRAATAPVRHPHVRARSTPPPHVRFVQPAGYTWARPL